MTITCRTSKAIAHRWTHHAQTDCMASLRLRGCRRLAHLGPDCGTPKPTPQFHTSFHWKLCAQAGCSGLTQIRKMHIFGSLGSRLRYSKTDVAVSHIWLTCPWNDSARMAAVALLRLRSFTHLSCNSQGYLYPDRQRGLDR